MVKVYDHIPAMRALKELPFLFPLEYHQQPNQPLGILITL